SVLYQRSRDHRDLHSFPTRRSSDLEQFAGTGGAHERIRSIDDVVLFKVKIQRWRGAVWLDQAWPWVVAAGVREEGSSDDFYSARSEEHTSELQSPYDLVCRLLLEKK